MNKVQTDTYRRRTKMMTKSNKHGRERKMWIIQKKTDAGACESAVLFTIIRNLLDRAVKT